VECLFRATVANGTGFAGFFLEQLVGHMEINVAETRPNSRALSERALEVGMSRVSRVHRLCIGDMTSDHARY
jgi:hypothetical protein